MFSSIQEKLKSNTGATLLLALIFFLLCAVCGAVVLTAGSASSGRIAGLAESEQDYYTVTSAAQVVKSELEELEFEVVTEETETDSGTVTEIVSTGIISEGYLNYILERPLSKIARGEIPSYSDESIKFTLAEEAVGTVKGTLTIDSSYNIEMLLKTDSNKYSCKITANAISSEQTDFDENTMKTTITTTVTWDEPEPVIRKPWIKEQKDIEEEVVS